jgi:hypothetical protein
MAITITMIYVLVSICGIPVEQFGFAGLDQINHYIRYILILRARGSVLI